MTSNAPDCLSVYSSSIAPKTMTRIRVAVNAPRIEAAAINVGDICQPTYAATAAMAHAMGIVIVAGW